MGVRGHTHPGGGGVDHVATDGDAWLDDGNVTPRVERVLAAVGVAAALCAYRTPAQAHEGPPFPIIVDEPLGPYVVSVWTDPDIGTGTFFVVLEPVGDARLPAGTVVRIGVRPIAGGPASRPRVPRGARPRRPRRARRPARPPPSGARSG